MKATKLALILPVAVWGQENYLSVSEPSWKGIEVRFLTRIEPVGAGASRLPGGVYVGPGRVHHVIQDASRKRYFGYDIVLEPAPDGGSARLRIEPLQASSLDQSVAGPGWTFLALPKYPVIPNVRV